MAMLASGDYGLCKKNVANERKSMIFVKLTDSAQRALNHYLSKLKDCEIPFIEFNKDEGRILIPTYPKGNNVESNEYVAQFKFDVISNLAMQGMQGRFECVQHRRGNRQLLKFGQLTQRLRIHANEDVYETTKNRMAAIELEQRKNCTRQLDWTSNINQKKKLDKFNNHSTMSTSAGKFEDKESRNASSTSVLPSLQVSNMIRSKSRPMNNAPPQRPNSTACKIRKPLKERILHMLAVKPYKISELYNVLKQEGIRDCDKSSLTEVLKSVTTVRDNFYHLAKHAWSDVQEDWLFYCEQEKQAVIKNKTRNLTSPSSSSSDSGISTSSSQSPNAASIGDISPPSSYKRPGYINGADGFLTKRQRISHFSRQEPVTSNQSSRLPASELDEATATASTQSPLSEETTRSGQNSVTVEKAAPVDTNNYSPSEDISAVVISTPENSSTSYGLEDRSEINKANDRRSPSAPPLADRNGQFVIPRRRPSPVLAAANEGEKPKYLKEYVTIVNKEQRRKYKGDFNMIFEEYTRVRKEIDSISNAFAQMGESLKQHTKGTPKYNKIEAEIIKKYYALKSSHKYQAAKRRYEYLHEKLSHIKKLVNDYDETFFIEGDTEKR